MTPLRLDAETIVAQFVEDNKHRQPSIEPGRVIVLYGPPCAGKTTIGQMLESRFNLRRISLDQLRGQYLSDPADFSPESNREIFALLVQLISKLLERGESILCEGLFIAHDRRNTIARIASPSKVLFIYFTAPLLVLHERLTQRHQVGLNSEAMSVETLTHEQLAAHYAACEPPKDAIPILDTSNESIDETFKRAITRVAEV